MAPIPQSFPALACVQTFHQLFSCPPSNRITSETFGVVANQWHYDSNGLLDQHTWGDASSPSVFTISPAAKQGLGGIAKGDPLATVTDPLGNPTVYRFDIDSRLVTQIEPNGATTTWTRDGAGRVTQLKDPLGRTTSYTRDSAGYVTLETLPDSHTRSWTYDPNFHGVATFTDERGNTTTYVYNSGNGHLESMTNALNNETDYAYSATTGLLASETDPLGKLTAFVYDTYRRQTQAKTTYSLTVLAQTDTAYDSWGNPASDTDALGLSTAYLFDAMGRKTFEQLGTNGAQSWTFDDSGLVTESQNQNLHRTQYVYDDYGRGIVASTVEGANTQQARSTLYTFDLAGHTQGVRQPNGCWHTFLLDSVGQALTDTDPLGGKTRNVYDLAGQRTDTWNPLGFHTHSDFNNRGWVSETVDPTAYTVDFSFAPNGLATGWSDSEGRGQSKTYDALNRVDTTTDGNGATTDTDYWQDGRVKQFTDELGTITRFDVNLLNRLSSETQAYDVPGLERTIVSSFNAAGFVTEVENGLGFVTYYEDNGLHQVWKMRDDNYMLKATYLYDGLGQGKKVTDAETDDTQEAYDGLERATSFTDASNHESQVIFDSMDQKVADIDGLGHVTKYVNDALGRQTFIVDANGGMVQKNYDPFYLAAVVDPLGNATRYANDADGRVIKEVDPLNHATTYTRDTAGRVTVIVDRNGRERDFGYDHNDNKTSETWKDSSGTTVDSFSFTFNAKNEMLTAMEGTSGYTFTFDELARPKTQTDPNGFVITINYVNASDRINTVADSAGATRQYYYYNNVNSNISPDNVRYVTFSGTGLPDLRWDFSYDKRDNVTEINRYRDLSGTTLVARSDYTYAPNGFLAAIDHLNASSATIDYFHYSQDAANRVTSEESKVSGSSSTRNFTYDNINQLLTDGFSNYSFDKAGNDVNIGTFGTANRLSTDGTWNYTWDNEGNLTQQTNISTGYVWKYEYNNRNQLTKAQRFDNSSNLIWEADYAFDVLGNRSSENLDIDGAGPTAAVLTKFAYDNNGNAWADLDSTGNITTRRLYLDAVDALFAKIGSSGDVDYYLTDRQGSVRDIYRSTGLQKEIDYSGFGWITLKTGSGPDDRYGYTGREYDYTSRILYARGRSYSVDIHQWMSEDPLKFAAGDYDLYRYVGNNATNATDPSGLEEEVTGADVDRMRELSSYVLRVGLRSQIVRCAACHNPIIMGGGSVADLPEDYQRSAMMWTRTENVADCDRAIQGMRDAESSAIETFVEGAITLLTAPLAAPLQSVRYIGWVFRTPGLRGVLWGLATDATTQGIMIATGRRDSFDVTRMLFAGAAGGTLDLAIAGGAAAWRRFRSGGASSARTSINPIAEINRNADLATEMARRAAARGRLNGTAQHFGDYAHQRFEQLNNRLNRRLIEEGSPFRVSAEEFRDATGRLVQPRAPGSRGADAVLRRLDNPGYIEIFDLKTHGGTMRLIGRSRQAEFMSRFGANAQELFRLR